MDDLKKQTKIELKESSAQDADSENIVVPQAPDAVTETAIDASWGDGSMIENLAEPLILYRNRKAVKGRAHRGFKLMLVMYVMIFAVFLYALYIQNLRHFPVVQDLWMQWLALLVGLPIWGAICYRLSGRINQSVVPVMEMRSEGLAIHTEFLDFPLIPWSEIKEARAYKFDTLAGVCIVPIDLKRTLEHGSIATRFWIRCGELFGPLNRLVGLSSIDIPALLLPLSAEEVAEQINVRKAHALGLNQGSSKSAELGYEP